MPISLCSDPVCLQGLGVRHHTLGIHPAWPWSPVCWMSDRVRSSTGTRCDWRSRSECKRPGV